MVMIIRDKYNSPHNSREYKTILNMLTLMQDYQDFLIDTEVKLSQEQLLKLNLKH